MMKLFLVFVLDFFPFFFLLFFFFFCFFFYRYDEWIKADKIVRPANKNVPKIKHRKKIKV